MSPLRPLRPLVARDPAVSRPLRHHRRGARGVWYPPLPTGPSAPRTDGSVTETAEVRLRARFFSSRERLRQWFERNHESANELWIAYYKKGVPRTAVSYPEAVEEALAFGWVDGQVRSLDEESYANRYTPRRPGSRWSRANVRKVLALRREGVMRPAGLAAFARRDPRRPAGYTFEERPRELAPGLRRRFEQETGAWAFFARLPPSYRRTAIFWVMSARRDETRLRRLEAVIAHSRRRQRIDLLSPRVGASRRGAARHRGTARKS